MSILSRKSFSTPHTQNLSQDCSAATGLRWPALHRSVALGCALVILLGVAAGCSRPSRIEKIVRDNKKVEDFDNSLTFNSVTLEEFDSKGRLWWKVKAKQASYSKDKKVARIKDPSGDFFQDGKAILNVVAKEGEVQQNGQSIFLRGQITATDTRDGLVLRGNELEWQPRNDLLIVRDNLTGTHKQMNLAAKEGKFFSRERRMELQGQVVATATDPELQFRSDHVVWQIAQQTLTSDRPLQINRYKNKVPTDQATANQGVVSLKDRTATLKQNAQVIFSKPPMQLSSNALVWSLAAQTVVSNEALTVVNREQQVTLSANQGRMDLNTNLVFMTGAVHGVGGPNQARINSDRLNWNLITQQFQADGNVTYQQANPPLNLTGPRASGRLQDQMVVVSGGQVVTEFVP